ncbi:MAG: hypothetical protein HYU64_00200 [Armatimonadetes bacterium]|nr:hypothetical protein [Armatimonadota bacterium]
MTNQQAERGGAQYTRRYGETWNKILFDYYLKSKTCPVLLWEILKHPFALLRNYRKVQREAPVERVDENGNMFYRVRDKEELVECLVLDPSCFLFAVSYCQKPHSCPSGRYTANCSHPGGPVCDACGIGKMKAVALRLGVRFHISTTGHWAVVDALIPMFRRTRKKMKPGTCMVSTCPMVCSLIKGMAGYFDLRAAVYNFRSGVCGTLKEYDLAERGLKREKPRLAPSATSEMMWVLQEAEERLRPQLPAGQDGDTDPGACLSVAREIGVNRGAVSG